MEILSQKVLCILMFATIVACAEQAPGSDDDGKKTSALDFADNPLDAISEQDLINKNIIFSEIQGAWNSPCERGSVEYVQRHLRIDATTFHQQNQFHPDATCTTTTKAPFVISGKYEIGDDVVTNSGSVAKKFDYLVEEEETLLRLPDIVFIANGILYFGIEQNSNSRPNEIDFNFGYSK